MPETETLQNDQDPRKTGPNPLGVFILVLAAIFLAAWAVPVIGAFFAILFGGIFAILGAIFGLIVGIFSFIVAILGGILSLILGLFTLGLVFLPMIVAGALAVLLTVVIVKALRKSAD